MRHPDGNWGGFSYAWNAQQTDATLVQGGAVRDIGGGQNWIFPSELAVPQAVTRRRPAVPWDLRARSSTGTSPTRRRAELRTNC